MSCRFAIDPPLARLTLDAPPVNVLAIEAIHEMAGWLAELATRRDVHVLVLDAAGDAAFSAGVEVRDHLPERLDEMLDQFHRLCHGLYDLEAVTVALVQGSALGGAMELVACCDFVVAAEEAVFAQPEIDLACFPPLAATLYPKRFGSKAAAEIVLLGRRFSAAEAQALGLVSRVVTKRDLEAEGQALVRSLAGKSPAALRIAKRALRAGNPRMFEGLGEVEMLYREELAATKDMLEGLNAFIEKRKPDFTGE